MRLQNEVLLRLTLSSSFLFFSFFSFLFFLNDAPARMQAQSQSTQVYIQVALAVLFYPPWLDVVIDPAKSHRRCSFKPCQCLRILSTNSERRRRPY